MALGATYCLVFLTVIIYNYCKGSNKQRIKPIFIVTAIIHIVAWLVHFVASMTTYINTESNLNDNHDIANYIICAMIPLHPLFFYIHTTLRIHHSFKISAYKLKLHQLLLVIFFGSASVISRIIGQSSWILIIAGNPPIIDVDKILNCLFNRHVKIHKL